MGLEAFWVPAVSALASGAGTVAQISGASKQKKLQEEAARKQSLAGAGRINVPFTAPKPFAFPTQAAPMRQIDMPDDNLTSILASMSKGGR